jgi:DNA ligase (NAD+)
MDIDGIAEATVETMVDNELLSHPLDYYRLTVESLTPYLGVKTATKLIARIKQSLIDVDPYRVLYGMGINNVGEGTAKRIMEVYQPHEVDKFNISLENIPDIGPITAGSITEYFNAPSNRDNYLKLVNLMTFKAPEKTSNELDGQTWVITGSFGELSREVVKAYLESMGAKVSNKVSKATTTLLVGDGKPGSKLKDAEDMNCNICTIMNTDAVHTVEDLMLPYEF